MAKKSKREMAWLVCKDCGRQNYRTQISTAEGSPKLELKRYCRAERKHTGHKLRRK